MVQASGNIQRTLRSKGTHFMVGSLTRSSCHMRNGSFHPQESQLLNFVKSSQFKRCRSTL
jgi:hypothetical protein